MSSLGSRRSRAEQQGDRADDDDDRLPSAGGVEASTGRSGTAGGDHRRGVDPGPTPRVGATPSSPNQLLRHWADAARADAAATADGGQPCPVLGS